MNPRWGRSCLAWRPSPTPAHFFSARKPRGRLEFMSIRIFTQALAILALVGAIGTPNIYACEASCPEPNPCSCTAGPCTTGFVESCIATCPGACSCACVPSHGERPSPGPKLNPIPKASSTNLQLGGGIDVNSLGGLIHEFAGWGVIVVGDGTRGVSSGSWNNTLENIIASMGQTSNFTPSWNDTTHVLTLTVN